MFAHTVLYCSLLLHSILMGNFNPLATYGPKVSAAAAWAKDYFQVVQVNDRSAPFEDELNGNRWRVYLVSASPGEEVSAELQGTTDGPFELAAYDRSGNPICRAGGNGGTIRVRATADSDLIMISVINRSEQPAQYSLRID